MIDKLTDISGIGAKRAESLEKLGITTPYELLLFSPRRYLDFTTIRKLYEVELGEWAAFQIRVEAPPRLVASKKGMKLVTAKFSDSSGEITVYWFNQPYMHNAYRKGDELFMYGKMDISGKTRRVSSPAVYAENPKIVPIYPLKAGITQNILRAAIKSVLKACKGCLEETLPQKLLDKYQLLTLEVALNNLHFPGDTQSLLAAKKRLAFEDMLLFRLAIDFIRLRRNKKGGIQFNTAGVLNVLTKKLPFELTPGQLNAISDIEKDMGSNRQMNRLVQGDVGSGKTMVAVYAMCVAAKNGYQSVLLAPTEILANQHYNTLCSIAPKEQAVLLTGSMTKKAKAEAYEKIKAGEYLYITGTHALLQSGLEFSNLGLTICDEQQRFGVEQRTRLQKSNVNPDVLIMSATPIPRTLSLVLYGDLSVSRISGMPKGRQPIKTRIVPRQKRTDMYKYLAEEAKSGKQSYVVCPQIEDLDGESVYENVKDLYKELTALLDVNIGLLHGKMKAKDKADAMEAFRRGETQILVATTVIEVGVDIPNAANMVIENADMFGLSQLHQLRGRIGRGSLSGYCFLLPTGNSNDRLDALVATNDGFEIAEKDLELRGPGQFLGSEQHGVSELAMLSLACDMQTLNNAAEAAELLLTTEYSDKTQSLLNRALAKFNQGGDSSDLIN